MRIACLLRLGLLPLSINVALAAEPEEGLDEEQRATHRVDAVEVTAARGTASDSPNALAIEVIRAEDAIAEPADFQDLITRVPGVGATGQNGVFETFSIRGSGANNIQILFGGMPLTSQRRAGIPVSFVEPALLGDISVTRGPAVVHYGPGALGGAVSVEPRWFDAPYVSTGYATGGDETVLVGATGTEHISLGAARHVANDTEAPDGTPLHTQFERSSAVMQYRTGLGIFDVDAMLALSGTDDIGKSNSRFPARDTIYPHDDHAVARVRLQDESGFAVSLHGHDQELRTWNRRPGFPDTFADVESRDIGATVQKKTYATDRFEFDVGVEYLGRRDVNAFDASGTIGNRKYTLLDGREDGWSLFAISDWAVTDDVMLELGARHSEIDQEQRDAEVDDGDTAYTAGVVWKPADAHRWSANVARGFRFASLEERYFSGVTAQGEVVGNANLGTERSLGIDLGYAWKGEYLRAEAHVWRNDVDDLIQLTSVAPDVNGYTNIGEAALHGVDASLEWFASEAFSLRVIGTLVESEDGTTGDPLFGTPPATMELDGLYRVGDFTFGARWQHRWAMDEPGFEEVVRDAVDLVDAEVSWRATPSFVLKAYVQNVFDEQYFATADALSALSPERSFGLKAVWQPD